MQLNSLQPRKAVRARITTLITLTAVCALVTSGCSSPSSTAASGSAGAATLEFPNFQGSEVPFSTWWGDFVKAYEAKYPNVTVKMIDFPASAALSDNLVTRFAAGNQPDVIQMTTPHFGTFATPGELMPLDDLIKGTNVKNYGPLQDSFVWKGKTLGVMTLSGTDVLYYNEKLLRDANQTVPKTADEFIAAAKALSNPKAGIYGFAGASAPGDQTQWTETSDIVTGVGGHWAVDDKPTLTDPATVKAFSIYRDLMKTSPRGLSLAQKNDLFYSGRAAFMMGGQFIAAQIPKKAAKDIAPLLKAARLPFENAPGGATVFLSIPKGLSAARQKNAENFVKLAISPEWQKKYVQIVGVPAPDPESVKGLEGTDPNLALFSTLNTSAINKVPTGVAITPNIPQIQKLLYDSLSDVTTTDKPIDAILQDLQTKVLALMKQ